jgi:hypothetical protein
MDIPEEYAGAMHLIKAWIEQADLVMSELMSASVMIANQALSDKEQWTIGSLSTACLRITGSVFLLLEHGREWDAAILDRSLTEGTLKLLYLLEDKKLFKDRLNDYSEIHFEVSQVKDHNKAEDFIKCLRDLGIRWPKSVEGMLLSPSVLN